MTDPSLLSPPGLATGIFVTENYNGDTEVIGYSLQVGATVGIALGSCAVCIHEGEGEWGVGRGQRS